MNYEVILLAAGQGKRMLTTRNKILLPLSEKPIIVYSLEVFLADPACQHLILVVQEEEAELMRVIIQQYLSTTRIKITIVVGGLERQDSVYQGLAAMSDPEAYVLVHDGARPFVTPAILTAVCQQLPVKKAVIAGIPVKDTIKKTFGNQVVETVSRSGLWQIQTPQGFVGSELKIAHQKAQEAGFLGTDDASLMEVFSQRVITVVMGSDENIKLTTPVDLIFAEGIANRRSQQASQEESDDSDWSRI